MQNPDDRGSDKQTSAAAPESAAPIVAAESIALLDPLVDKTRIIILPDESLKQRFDHEAQYVRQVPGHLLAGQEKEPKRETSFLGEVLRFTGAVVGFLAGGSAGAALGSVVGELAGDIAAEQSNIIWPKLLPSFLNPKRAHHEEDA